MTPTNPKVSIPLIAYNHEHYVRQSLDSALMQETDFPYEIVVGEDCSTDGTREVLMEYQQAHPDKIRLLFREKNLGMQMNYQHTVRECKGEYLAVLDSDDYWTRPDKLARQVRFMEENPGHSISFHRAEVHYEGSPDKKEIIPGVAKAVSNIDDILITNYIPNCTCMYRASKLPKQWPDWYGEVVTYDWPLHCLVMAEGGTIGFMDMLASVYRVHNTSMWSSLSERKRLQNEVFFYEKIIEAMPEQHKPRAGLGKAGRMLDLANNFRREGEREEARRVFEEALKLESEEQRLPLRKKLRLKALLIPK
jgi:glycosyltransferase involved in cell wall biosynthesis